MLKFIENHPYKTVIGLIIGIMGIVLTIIFWLFPISYNKNDNVDNAINVFDLVEKISLEKTTLARQNKLSEYYNSPIKGVGFIIDAEQGLGSQDKYLITKIVKNLEKNEYGRYTSLSIECKFLKKWNKTLQATDFSKEIKFTGTIPDKNNFINPIRLSIDYDSATLEIDDCTIVK